MANRLVRGAAGLPAVVGCQFKERVTRPETSLNRQLATYAVLSSHGPSFLKILSRVGECRIQP